MDISTARRPVSAAPITTSASPAQADTPEVSAPIAANPAPKEVVKSEPAPTALPVREAPRNDDQLSSGADQDNQSETAVEATTESVGEAVSSSQQTQPKHDGTPAPFGAIVGAILIMMVLSFIAVMIYLKSQ